jgi:hypothetical protein
MEACEKQVGNCRAVACKISTDLGGLKIKWMLLMRRIGLKMLKLGSSDGIFSSCIKPPSSDTRDYFRRFLNSPVSIASRSEALTVFGRSNIGIAVSNPARGMDVCLCFSVLCCPVCR